MLRYCLLGLFFTSGLCLVVNHNSIPKQEQLNSPEQVNFDQHRMRRVAMKAKAIRPAKRTYPTGNPKFSVMQAFPSGISDSDPFLMCDHFGPTPSKGLLGDDEFPVGWHPHRGMDILTYIIEGRGRHADSMGNRESFASPGMQWISVGSGIEHAEGGGTPAGENEQGFQIWINVPAKHKMDPPAYGTEPPENIPFVTVSTGVTARILAGPFGDATGPFKTKQDVQMVDYMLEPGAAIEHTLKDTHDNCLVYIYNGSGDIGDAAIVQHQVAQMDCTSAERTFTVRAGAAGIKFLIFAGKRINEPVAWRGPFVMNTYDEIERTMMECRRGEFPPVRVPWDYQSLAAFPPEHRKEL